MPTLTALTKANQQSGALWNRRFVLRLLQKHRELSRGQIAQMTALRGSTLSYIVRELMERDIIRLAGTRDAGTVGPKQQLLELNPYLGYVIGVDMRRHHAQIVVRDAAGGLVDVWELGVRGGLEQMPQQLHEAVTQRLNSQTERFGSLLGVGMGLPGIVDYDEGVVLKSTPFEVRDLPLRELLADRFGDCTILVDHNANFAALAEHREGAARDLDQFIVFLINHNDDPVRPVFRSFGAALFLNGRIHRGVHFAAGELDSHIAPIPPFPCEAVELDCLRQSDAPLTDRLRELAVMVSRTIGSLVNFLDPAAVVLGGHQVIANVQFLDMIQQHLPQRVIPIRGRQMAISASTLGSQAVARGAALAVADAALLGHEAMAATVPTGMAFG